MKLFVIRHGEAEEHTLDRGDDAQRALTPEGVRRFKRVVHGLRELDWSFTRVITSPWVRAASTAELLVRDAEPIVTPLLARPPTAELLAMIGEATGAKQTAVVGHQPWLGELVAWLAFGDMKHGDAIALKKGAVVYLEGTAMPGAMTLRAILPPRVLRTIR